MERKIIIRKSRHFFERNSNILKTIGLILLVLSIPLTVYVLNQIQDIRQRAAGALVPITSNFPPTGCPVTFNDLSDSSTKTYKVPVFCLNQTYCVTQGFDKTSGDALGLPFPSFGGDITTSRKFAVAFITHYHTKVLKDWTNQPFTGTVFTDVKFDSTGNPPNLGVEIETAAHYGFIRGSGGAFNPEDPWVFGFHGIYRAGSFDNNNPTPHAAEECWQGACYNFSAAGVEAAMSRGAFIEKLYTYGIDPTHQNLNLCMIAPTAPPVAPTATPAIAACNSSCASDTDCSLASGCTVCKPSGTTTPILDFTQLTGSSCQRNFAAKLPDGSYREPTYPTADYRLAVECMNKGYCVVQGYSTQTCPAGSSCTDLNPNTSPPEGFVGGELATTRKFAVAFIARYHADVIATTDSRHWGYVNPTGTVFKDLPLGDLSKEIETAYNKGFISGAACNTIYPSTSPYYSADSNVKCFDPDGNWLYGFKGIEKSDYFTGATPINPWNFTIKRGEFLKQLYAFGTSPSHPDLAKCMTAPSSTKTCQAPSTPTTAPTAPPTAPTSTPVPPTPTPVPACGTVCTSNTTCSPAANGCNTCNSVTGKCSVAACNVSCSRDSDCAGAATRDGCTSCIGGTCQVPFNPGACHCDGIDATTIGTGQKVTFTAYSKVEGAADVASAKVKEVNIRVFRGGDEIQDQIAQSGYLPSTIIVNTPTLVRYQTKWDYMVPADANNGDLFRVQADMNCQPKSLAIVPNYKQDKGIIATIVDKITEPFRAVLQAATGPTPVPPKSIQISSFYPGEITDRASCYFHFKIKR